MEVLVFVAAALVLAVGLPLGQAALASARWGLVIERDAVRGSGAYRSASIPRTRMRWSGVHPSVLAACALGVILAVATACLSLAGLFLPPAWPVAFSGFALACVLLATVSRLACKHSGAGQFVRRATTYSFVHHGAVVLTFTMMAPWMPEVLAFVLVTCGIGVAITAYLRVSVRTEIEREDVSASDDDGHAAAA